LPGLAILCGCGTVVTAYYPLAYPPTPAYAANYATAVAQCVAGIGTPESLSIPSSNAPPLGCVSAGTSPLGYFAFHPAAAAQEYAFGETTLPSVWVGSDMALTFYAEADNGDTTWQVETACSTVAMAGMSPVYGPPASVTTAVSATAGPAGLINTSTLKGVAVAGTNGCAPGATLAYRITRLAGDSTPGETYLVGLTLTQRGM
jgi:hypothetical protein